MTSDDSFQTVSKRKSAVATKRRIYVGNIPCDHGDDDDDDNDDNIRQTLTNLCRERANSIVEDLTVVRGTIGNHASCHALVTCSGNPDRVVRAMQQVNWGGKRLVVQLENRPRQAGTLTTIPSHANKGKATTTTTAPPFGRTGWTKPRNLTTQRAPPEWSSTVPDVTAFSEVDKSGELEATPDEEDQEPAPDFQTRLSHQHISELINEYGEEDTSWRQQRPQPLLLHGECLHDEATETTTAPQDENRLALRGKAPIHIELVSFGYHYGAPAELRTHGWSHAQPLPPFDARDLTPIPNYLAWRDGLSGIVKRTLINMDPPNVSNLARDMADQVELCLVEAIDQGGHGYALPLRMLIYVGSELGRHRSVVAVEMAAKALRAKLRTNTNNQIRQPCSVGTRHRDLERNSNHPASRENTSDRPRPKQKDLEDAGDW